jgi:hypothetical protein
VTCCARRRVAPWWRLAAGMLLLAAPAAAPAAGQVQPGAPPAARDTVVLAPGAGTGGAAGTGQVLPDSTQAQDSVSADTIFYNLPEPARGTPSGFATGVWEWDREAIMASTASTLYELLSDVPGVIALMGGDYGTPAALSAFASGGGGVRILRDGFEVVPLEGGVVDLARVGLGGIQRVRMERRGGEMVIALTSYRYDDGRPYSLVEAGTGQLNTNLFSGVYADPVFLGGSVALNLERLDTRGYGTDEGGSRTGSWFRYQLHRGDRAGIALEYRSMSSRTEVPDYPTSVQRKDLTARARFEIVPGVVAEAYTGRSTHDVKDSRDAYALEGGTRAQHGLRLSAERAGAWAVGSLRLHPDDDLPSRRIDGSGGYGGSLFGAYGNVSQADWDGASVLGYGAGGWIGPLAGVTLFGSYDGGEYAGADGPVVEAVPLQAGPLPAPEQGPFAVVTRRSLLRGGASAERFGITVAGAGLRAETDRQVPLGLPLDRGATTVPGLVRYGFEGTASVPLPVMEGLRLEGSYQQWDQGGPYLPRRIYRAAFVFHRVYLESENFELWWSVGVRGHDLSQVFVEDTGTTTLATVPFYQNWYGHITARIVTVRLFFTWENMAVRRNLQSYPGRLFSPQRTFFGLRWDLWN